MSGAKAALLFCCLIAGTLDLLTTNMILERGGGEANPFMLLAQMALGHWWLIPKLGTVFLVMWLLSRSNKLPQIAFVAALMSTAPLSNLRVLSGMI